MNGRTEVKRGVDNSPAREWFPAHRLLRMARRGLVALIPIAAFALVLTACGDDDDATSASSGAAIGECPDLTGEWHSSEYDVLTVNADGTHQEYPGVTMVLDVKQQDGCHFSAVNTLDGSDLAGSQFAAGVLNPDGNWITIHEVGEHPEEASSGRALGRLLENGHMTFEYAAYSDDGSHANVFSTILTREGTPTVGETCPDMLGTWTGYPFDVLNVYADGSTDQQTQTSNVLEVEHQAGCTFRGINSWMRGDLGGSEHVAGVVHSDGVLITMLEVGPHPEQGTRAFIQARLRSDHVMEWDYAGISDDSTKGQGFTTSLVREGDPGPREECDDLTGKWSTDEWDGLRVLADGTHEPISSDFHDFEITEQIGCTLKATSTYGALNGEGEEWMENWVGVINGEEGILIMRAVAPPSDQLASLLFARVASDTELHAEYSGFALDGSAVLVYLQRLVKE